MARRARELAPMSLAETFDQIRSDYNAAKTSRFRRRRTGISSAGSGADYHYRTEAGYLRMMEYAWDMFRNDCLLSQGVRRFVHNVVRNGFAADPQTGDTELDAYLFRKWNRWAGSPEQCEVSGRFSFHDMEKLTVQQVVVGGDLFHLLLGSGRLEMAEGHRCKTASNTRKNVVHGVLLDELRRPLEYWFTRDELNPYRGATRVGDMRRIAARDEAGNRNVLHLFRPDRVSQTRGVTALCPIFDTIGMHDDIQFAKLVQQQVASAYAIIEEVPEEGILPPTDDGSRTGARETETLSDGTTRTVEGISPGMRIRGAPGSKLRMDSPNVPNAEFFQHAMMMLTIVAVNLNLPVAVLLLDPTRTNFSGWRGAIDQARISLMDWQQWLIASLHTPVYRWKVRQWIERDRDEILLQAISREGDRAVDVFAHRFNTPSAPYIEPHKDAMADLVRERNLLISRRRRCAERGYDWDTLAREIVGDNALLIRLAHEQAQELNQQYPGLAISWQEVACLPTPDGVQMSMEPTGDDDGNDQSNAADRRQKGARDGA